MKFLRNFLKVAFPKVLPAGKSQFISSCYTFVIKLELNYSPKKFEVKKFKNAKFIKEMEE